MARRRNTSKHPALAATALQQRFQAMDQVDLEGLPGWETFVPDEKRFLSVYPWFGEKKLAAEYIGKTAQWVDRRQRRYPSFREAVDSRAGTPDRIAKQYGADLLGKGMMRLEEMLEPNGADKRTQLDAVKLLLRMNGVVEGEPVHPAFGMGNNQAVNVSVKMFGISKERPEEDRTVVEGQLLEPSEADGQEHDTAGHGRNC